MCVLTKKGDRRYKDLPAEIKDERYERSSEIAAHKLVAAEQPVGYYQKTGSDTNEHVHGFLSRYKAYAESKRTAYDQIVRNERKTVFLAQKIKSQYCSDDRKQKVYDHGNDSDLFKHQIKARNIYKMSRKEQASSPEKLDLKNNVTHCAQHHSDGHDNDKRLTGRRYEFFYHADEHYNKGDPDTDPLKYQFVGP